MASTSSLLCVGSSLFTLRRTGYAAVVFCLYSQIFPDVGTLPISRDVAHLFDIGSGLVLKRGADHEAGLRHWAASLNNAGIAKLTMASDSDINLAYARWIQLSGDPYE